MYDFDSVIRKVPDFPKKGILFYDITSLIADPRALQAVKQEMTAAYKNRDITKIIAVEARGFLLGPLLADALNIPLILARKKNKLPNAAYSQTYELEYGSDTIEVQQLDLKENDQVLIIDDLIATGGTIKALCDLIQNKTTARVTDIFAIIGLPFLNFREKLEGYRIKTLLDYNNE